MSDVRTIQAHEASDKYVAKLQRELAQTKEALAMSLRQWSAYYRDDESNDLETAKHAEADNYRWCMAALKKGETQ